MNDMKPEAHTANIGDAAIRYLAWGNEGPPLLLMHATGFLPWLWHPIARELSKDYRVIAPYFCSHRQSDPEEGGLSWRQLAGDITDFCRRLDIEKPFVVGHSMGGAVLTIACGAFGLAYSGMVLIEPIFLPEEFYGITIGVRDHPLARKSIKRRNFWENGQDVQNYLSAKAFFNSWDAEMLKLYKEHAIVPGENGGFELACHPRDEASLFMGSMAMNPWPLMPQVECPVLILEGELSENRGYIDLKKAAETFPDARYMLVEGAGHLIPMEMPAEVLAIVRDFFVQGDLNLPRAKQAGRFF